MNMTLRYHTANDYAVLRDMEGSDVGTLDDSDRTCLDELGLQLIRADAHRDFGVALLHRHFLVSDAEVLVETADPVGQTVQIRPVGRSAELEAGLTPVTVRFEDTADGPAMVGLEYLQQHDAPGNLFAGPRAAVLDAIRDTLQRRGKIDRFGIRLIHNPVRWDEDEVLFENSDVQERILDFQVGKRSDPQLQKSVETFWVWDRAVSAGGEEIAITHCPARCERICVPTGLGHDKRGHDSHGHGHQTGITG